MKDEIKQTVVDDEEEESVKVETKPVHVEFQEPEIIPIDDDVVQLKVRKLCEIISNYQSNTYLKLGCRKIKRKTLQHVQFW